MGTRGASRDAETRALSFFLPLPSGDDRIRDGLGIENVLDDPGVKLLAKLGSEDGATEFLALARHAVDEMAEREDAGARTVRTEHGVENDVANIAAGDFEASGKFAELLIVEVAKLRGREEFFPDGEAELGIGLRKFDNGVDAAKKSVVDIVAVVGGQDNDAGKLLDALEEIVDLKIHKAILSVLNISAGAEQAFTFIEEKPSIRALGFKENAAEIFLGLANPLADNGGEVDAV